MAVNLLPPEQLSSMTDFPMPNVNAQGFVPRVQAQGNNVLGSPSVMPPEFIKPKPAGANMVQGMQNIAKNLSAVHTTPGFNFKDSASTNLIRLQNRAKENSDAYKEAKKTSLGLMMMKTEHEGVMYQDLLSRQAAIEKLSAQNQIEARQRVRQLRAMRVDPSRFFKNQTAWENILGFVATVATGSVLRDMGLDPNMALVGIQNQIQQDVALQMQEIKAARQEHVDITKLDQDGIVEQIQLLKQRRAIYTDRSAIVKDQIEETAGLLDNSQSRDALLKLNTEISKIEGKEFVKLALAENGLVQAAASMKSHKAANNLRQKANEAAVKDGSIGAQGWTITDESQREHDPYTIAEKLGRVPDVVMDPANPKEALPNQGIVKRNLTRYLNAKKVENDFANTDSNPMISPAGKIQTKEMLVDSIDDFNTYNIQTGQPRYKQSSGCLLYTSPSPRD